MMGARRDGRYSSEFSEDDNYTYPSRRFVRKFTNESIKSFGYQENDSSNGDRLGLKWKYGDKRKSLPRKKGKQNSASPSYSRQGSKIAANSSSQLRIVPENTKEEWKQ